MDFLWKCKKQSPQRCDIAKQLAVCKAELNPDEKSRVFTNFAPNKAAKMLGKDLEAAEITYKDETGRVADFHSLRHTFISNLTRSSVSPKIAQSLARHSTIGLTMDTYTHIGLYDERTALDSLPELPSLSGNRNDENKVAALKTGTDDMSIGIDKSAYKPAYKKLTKNAYPRNNWASSFGKIDTLAKDTRCEPVSIDKSLSVVELETKTNHLSPTDTTEQEGFEPPLPERVKRFSRPSPSTTRPLLHQSLRTF